MTDKLVNEPMVRQRVLNEVNIHRDKGLRHPSIVRVCMLSVRSHVLPDCISDVGCVAEFRLLDVLVTSSLSMDRYIDFILSVVTQRFYLLG